MATWIEDAADYLASGYGHHCLFGHCSSELIASPEGRFSESSCHSNFLQAAQRRGLGEAAARLENMIVFQPASVLPTSDGRKCFGYADVPLQTKQG